MKSRIESLRAPAAMMIAMGLTACGSDSASTGSKLDAASPLYAIGAATYTTEGISGYVAAVGSLTAGEVIDYAKTLSIPGGGRIWGSNDATGSFFVVKDERATLTKYEVAADGSFVERETISFAAYGITSLRPAGSRVDVVSSTKAYFFDATTSQAIVWNPETMTIAGRIDLAGLAKTGWGASFGFGRTLLRGPSNAELVVFVFYENMADQKFAPEIRLARIDTNANTAAIVTDTRCSTMYATTTAAGDVYFSSDGRGATYHRLAPAGSPSPCMLRLRAAEAALDPSFHVELSALTDGSATGGLIPAADGSAYLLALDETLVPVSGATATQIYGAPAWRWWKIALGTTSAGTRTSLAPTPGGVTFMSLASDTYATDAAVDFSKTTLVRTSTASDPERGLELRGVPTNIVRVR